jgi:formamidopyrimidine-DNA glycosylase
MTGRMYIVPNEARPSPHVVVSLQLDRGEFVFQDLRRFGRFTTDLSALERLGPEPLGEACSPTRLAAALRPSRQAIKVRLLDQRVVAGIGNLYASELLHRARVHPGTPCNLLSPAQVRRVHRATRTVLAQAIRFGSTVPLTWSGQNATEPLFYYGQVSGTEAAYTERLRVYDRAGQPCPQCATPIRRLVQAGRSTYYCPVCQAG